MSGDERIVVLGGEAPPPQPPGRAGPRLAPLLVAAGLIGILLVALVGSPSAPAVSTEPDGLTAPPDPSATVSDDSSSSSSDIPPLALGWRTVELVSGGWSVNGLAHGDDGWLAVTAGDAVVAHTSDDGVVWHGRTLPDLDGYLARAAVGDGVMAVVMSGGGSSAISTDRGDTWTLGAVDGRVAWVDDVVVVDGMTFAFGSVADDRLDPGKPAVWRWDGTTWAASESAGGATGFVGAVTAGPDGQIRAFGAVDGNASAWIVSDGGLEQVAVDVPAPWTAINEVLPDVDRGFVGLAGDGDASTGRALLESKDLVTWTQLSANVSLANIAVGPDSTIVASSSSSGHPWSMGLDGNTVWLSGGGLRTGREEMTTIERVAASPTTVVLSGYDDVGRPMLAVRGPAANPLSLLVLAEPAWSVVATVDVGPGSVGPTVANGGDITLVHAGATVWELSSLDDGAPNIDARVEARVSGAWPNGVWARTGTELQLERDGAVSTVGFEGRLLAIGEISDELMALGGDKVGETSLLRLVGDEWQPVGELVDELVFAVPLRSGFAGSTGGGPGSTVLTSDGEKWTAIDGDLQGIETGVPFVGDGQRITLLDLWPVTEDLDVPSRGVRSVLRDGERFVLHSPGSVWVGSPDVGWERIPAGLQDGVPASAVLVPAEVPTLVALVGEWLLLLQPIG